MPSARRTFSTRTRAVTAVVAALAVFLALIGTIVFTVQHASVLGDIDGQLRSDSPFSDAGTTKNSAGTATSVTQALRNAVTTAPVGSHGTAVGIVGGEIVTQTPRPLQLDNGTDAAVIAQIVADVTRNGTTLLDTAQLANTRVRYLASPVTVPGDGRTGVYVQMIDLDTRLDAVTMGILTYILACLVALVGGGFLAWWAVGRLLLGHSAAPQGRADPVPSASLAPPPDPATITAMMEQVEGAADAQRRLLDDIRHELKTPITIVRGHLEMMDPHDPADVRATRDIGTSELDRMARLIEDIDMIATVEDSEFTEGTVDIERLTRRVGELVTAIPRHPWHVTTVAIGRVRGQQDRLLQAWLALADNAAKYTPTGTPIEIGSGRDEHAYLLWVRDHGPGIPPSLRHRIFRRFDRGGGRRDVGGSGLGLAIVDAIARGHGGSCTVTDTPGGGATFMIQLPVELGTRPERFPSPVRAGDVLMQREETE